MATAAPEIKAPPRKFFMSLRDLSFWARSSRADSLLKKIRREHGNEGAFDKLYEELRDPWNTNVPYYRYQLLKYQTILSFLPRRPYGRALDIGCGLGVLTRLMAPHAEHILGVDVSQCAIDAATRLSGEMKGVSFQRADLLHFPPESAGQYDLVIVIDTLYYLTPLTEELLERARKGLTDLLAPDGILLLVNHYYFGFDRLSRESREIHSSFGAAPGLCLVSEHRKPFYLASVLERTSS